MQVDAEKNLQKGSNRSCFIPDEDNLEDHTSAQKLILQKILASGPFVQYLCRVHGHVGFGG